MINRLDTSCRSRIDVTDEQGYLSSLEKLVDFLCKDFLSDGD